MPGFKKNSPGCCSCSGYIYGTGHIPFCFCESVPTTFLMTSSDHEADFGTFQDATIVYREVPAELAPFFDPLGEGGHFAFLSTESFPDLALTGYSFFYYMTCSFNLYMLNRIYPDSPFGSPYVETTLYEWFIGAEGNTCVPFTLANGLPFGLVLGPDHPTVTIVGVES